MCAAHRQIQVILSQVEGSFARVHEAVCFHFSTFRAVPGFFLSPVFSPTNCAWLNMPFNNWVPNEVEINHILKI
jgi:hypothetical protein